MRLILLVLMKVNATCKGLTFLITEKDERTVNKSQQSASMDKVGCFIGISHTSGAHNFDFDHYVINNSDPY